MDSLIYHYCSPEAFFNIVVSNSIWATDLLKTNDPEELNRGQEVALEAIRAVLPNRGGQFSKSDFVPAGNLYLAACFSHDGDVLSQWRAYAGNCRGMAVGVSQDALLACNVELLSNTESLYTNERHIRLDRYKADRFELKEVFYDEDLFYQFVVNLIEQLKVNAPSIDDTFEEGTMPITDILIKEQLQTLTCLLKSQFFSEEKEVRLFCRMNEITANRLTTRHNPAREFEIQFHPTDSGIRRYMPISLMQSSLADKGTSAYQALRQVIIGPSSSATTKDVCLFLRQNGFQDVEVFESSGKYR